MEATSKGATEKGGRLEGKVAVVTGGSRGIGRAICARLAAEGALVVVHYRRDGAAARATVEEIEARGGRVVAVCADLADPRGVDALFAALDAALRERAGSTGFDVLVNNAAIAPPGTLEQTTEPVFDEVFAVNVKAPFFVLQRALPRLRDGGRVINVSSVVTRIGYPAQAAYAMTKGALDTLTLLLAKQLGPRGITVNALSPGVIDTDMNAAMLGDPDARRYAAGLAVLGRLGVPEDVAGAAAFLASDDGRWVTGQRLDVSGGSFIG